MEVDGYLPMTEYTTKYKVSRQMIYRYLDKKMLKSKLINGKRCIEDKDFRELSSSITTNGVNQEVDGDVVAGVQSQQELLLDARIKKIRADTDYQLQRLEDKKEEILSEYTEQIIEAYTESFSGAKNELIALRLEKGDLQNFIEIFDTATKNFIAKLKKLRKNL